VTRGPVIPPRGRGGMRRGHAVDDLWSRRGGVCPCCTPRCKAAKRRVHRFERHVEKRLHIAQEVAELP
jgi:hypothetical protein